MTQHPHAELSAYIDSALDPAAQAAVDGHLAACAGCRIRVAELRGAISLIRALPDPLPSRSLVPRLTPPVWLAPMRTLMTLASGAAVFLFIASAVVSGAPRLTSGGATTTAFEASRDRAASGPGLQETGQPTSAPLGAPVPAASPNAAFALPTASADAATRDAARVDDAQKRQAQSTAAPTALGRVAVAPEQAQGLNDSAQPQRRLLDPWLWLSLALIFGAIAIALHRRLRSTT